MTKNRVPDTAAPSRRERKKALRELLLARDLEHVLTMARDDAHVVRTLPTMLFDREPLVCWRAIEALGQVAAMIAESDLERVRVMIRGQIWQMNDESGNVGWYAAEAIGEILYNAPILIDEYGALLLSYLHEEPFERGAHWAVARVASLRPDVYRERLEELIPSLESDDAYVRVFAMKALTRIDAERAKQYVERHAGDVAVVEFYDLRDGVFREAALHDLVKAAQESDGFPPSRE